MCLNDTLCWDCKNKKCSWVWKDKPIEGWQAEKTKNGYHVSECPKYISPIIQDSEKKMLKRAVDILKDKDLTRQEYTQFMSITNAIIKRLEGENEVPILQILAYKGQRF